MHIYYLYWNIKELVQMYNLLSGQTLHQVIIKSSASDWFDIVNLLKSTNLKSSINVNIQPIHCIIVKLHGSLLLFKSHNPRSKLLTVHTTSRRKLGCHEIRECIMPLFSKTIK